MSKTVLITNLALANRSGTEVVVEQLADGLRRRGHKPILFAPLLGPLAEEMRARGHIVTDRPSGFSTRPDIIHGHHTGPVMAAIAANPGVPALFVCHDASAAHDILPYHPRIYRIFAVDERCRQRLVIDGADSETVQILPNAVDLSRIPARRPLPLRPARAAAVTKHTSSHLPAVRAACSALGITLEEYGPAPGKTINFPEKIFAEVDLVFATARAALEASASGAGVIVCDARGCAGFLTRRTAEAWLPFNLGAGILAHPCDERQLHAAIADWSAAEAAAASALVREHRGIEPWLDRLETIYSEMLNETAPCDDAAEAAAVGTFIADWVPHYGQQAPWRKLADQVSSPPLDSPLETLQREVAILTRRVDELIVIQSRMQFDIVQKMDASTATHLQAIQTIARNAEPSAVASREALSVIDQKIEALAATHLQALQTIARNAEPSAVASREALGVIGQKIDALTATHLQALQTIALNAEHSAVASREALSVIDQKIDALAAAHTAALAAPRVPPSIGLRLEAICRGVYRRVLPLKIRAPLNRFRRRLLEALLR